MLIGLNFRYLQKIVTLNFFYISSNMCIDYIFYIIFLTFNIYYLEYIYEKCLKYSKNYI